MAGVSDSRPLDGYPIDAPPLRRPALVNQFWSDVTFVHWPVDPKTVAALFPPGTRPDVVDGMTYVALVPFAMGYTGLGTGPAIPYFGRFCETNVRLYSVDGAGRHGVVFRSLEAARLAVVPLVRTVLGVPYTWARMSLQHSGTRISYDSLRRWPDRGLRSHVVVDVGDDVHPSPLEVWLTARWGAHTYQAGRTWWVPNEHGPWPLRAAELIELRDDLVSAAGVVAAGPPLRTLYSPGVAARFGRPVVI